MVYEIEITKILFCFRGFLFHVFGDLEFIPSAFSIESDLDAPLYLALKYLRCNAGGNCLFLWHPFIMIQILKASIDYFQERSRRLGEPYISIS